MGECQGVEAAAAEWRQMTGGGVLVSIFFTLNWTGGKGLSFLGSFMCHFSAQIMAEVDLELGISHLRFTRILSRTEARTPALSTILGNYTN